MRSRLAALAPTSPRRHSLRLIRCERYYSHFVPHARVGKHVLAQDMTGGGEPIGCAFHRPGEFDHRKAVLCSNAPVRIFVVTPRSVASAGCSASISLTAAASASSESTR